MQEFYKNGDSPTIARKKFSSHHDLRNLNDAPNVSLVRKWANSGKTKIQAPKIIKNIRIRGEYKLVCS